jgi:Ca2+-binding EF-hand superfamily protein
VKRFSLPIALLFAAVCGPFLHADDKDKPNKPAASPEVERAVEALLERMDANKDGKISKDEAKGRIAANFDRLDTNKDGFLDKDELRVAAARFMANPNGKPVVGDRPGAAPIKPTIDFDALDKNADGRLTRDELRGTQFAEVFDEIDSNKDGKIDRKEFNAYLARTAEKTADKPAEKPADKPAEKPGKGKPGKGKPGTDKP